MSEAPDLRLPQGQSFSVLLGLDPEGPMQLDDLHDWQKRCQVRKFGNKLPNGLIEEFEITTIQANDGSISGLLLFHADTSLWPVGMAEFDILFINGSSEDAQRIRTGIVTLEIQRSVTK